MIDTILQYVVAPMLSAVISWILSKRWVSEQTWARIRKLAYAILADPTQTDDAKEAVAKAMLTAEVDRLSREASKVRDAFVMNGSNKVPKLELDITELKNDPDLK